MNWRRLALSVDAPGFDLRIHTVTEYDENGTPTDWELAEWSDANGNVTKAKEPEENME